MNVKQLYDKYQQEQRTADALREKLNVMEKDLMNLNQDDYNRLSVDYHYALGRVSMAREMWGDMRDAAFKQEMKKKSKARVRA